MPQRFHELAALYDCQDELAMQCRGYAAIYGSMLTNC